LTIYFSNNSRQLSFPEIIIPLGVLLRKFKKNTTNSTYRKNVAAFLDLLKRNEDFIIQKRLQIKDKSLKNLVGLLKNFEMELGKDLTPLEKEKEKIESRRLERLKEKFESLKKE
jgi:hypothetical protein